MEIVRAAMIGDVVGEPGLSILESILPSLKKEVEFVVVNGENAADGFGLTESTFKRIIAAGADIVTSGNHIWEKRDFLPFMDSNENILRPFNYPPGAPGKGCAQIEKNQKNWVVINLQGRDLMSSIECPFRCFDKYKDSLNVSTDGNPPIILVDFHAESSREKESLGYYLDGRVSLIAGTHTHVQTADERILPKGSAYITDIGMTGITDSVIGIDPKICRERVRKQVLYRMETAEMSDNNKAEVQGVIVEIETQTGKALSIKRIRTGDFNESNRL